MSTSGNSILDSYFSVAPFDFGVPWMSIRHKLMRSLNLIMIFSWSKKKRKEHARMPAEHWLNQLTRRSAFALSIEMSFTVLCSIHSNNFMHRGWCNLSFMPRWKERRTRRGREDETALRRSHSLRRDHVNSAEQVFMFHLDPVPIPRVAAHRALWHSCNSIPRRVQTEY